MIQGMVACVPASRRIINAVEIWRYIVQVDAEEPYYQVFEIAAQDQDRARAILEAYRELNLADTPFTIALEEPVRDQPVTETEEDIIYISKPAPFHQGRKHH
ncbi:MAG: hypothetical protein V2G42_06350 [bacterium JZ-2024 1]